MKDSLTPTLVEPVGSFNLLWFEISNQYIILAESLYSLIKVFLASKNKEQFIDSIIRAGFDEDSTIQFYKEIDQFLDDCNRKTVLNNLASKTTFNDSYRCFSCIYKIDNSFITVNFGSEPIKNLIHPQLSHLETNIEDTACLTEFDIYIEKDHLFLFKDKTLLGSWTTKEPHLMQGKFAMHILCALHNNKEMDWIGTFHASTVVKKDEAIMLIGDSGKGKSTFTALLLANGYEILADDITAILAADNFVYPYPGAISIKSGAFDTLKSVIPNFDKLPEHHINRQKGKAKYLGAPKSKDYLNGYPCKNIVSINYKKDSNTKLETISIAQALNTLIPESWLAPKKYNAQQFLNWIKDVQFYELTYSNSKEAIDLFSNLLEE
jgi:hypothetical protein